MLNQAIKLGFKTLLTLLPISALTKGGKKLIPILRYHSVDSTGSCHSTPTEVWNSHIHYLKEKDFSVVSIRDFMSDQYNPQKPVVIMTFDDGYMNNHEVVLPTLLKHHFTASFYFVTQLAGQRALWVEEEVEHLLHSGMEQINGPIEIFLDHAELNHQYISDHLPQLYQLGTRRVLKEIYYLDKFKSLELMTRDQVRELHQQGMEIGAHTQTHCYLSKLELKEAQREITQSKSQLEAIIQDSIESFCYPYGDYSKEVVDLVKKAGFETACGCEPGFFERGKDSLFTLKRIGMELVKGDFQLDFYLNWKYRKMLKIFWTRRKA